MISPESEEQMCRVLQAFFSLVLLINAGLFANNLSSCPGQPRQKHKSKQKQHMPSLQLSSNPIFPVFLCLLPSALSRVLITQAPSVDGEWGWVAGLQEENQDLGVICPAPQSPVVEEGEGEGGKVDC